MKLVEGEILNELKNLLCENLRVRTKVAVIEFWPGSYSPKAKLRYAPIGPEELEQYAGDIDNISDELIKQIHSKYELNIDDDPEVREKLYRFCEKCEGKGCEECEDGIKTNFTRGKVYDIFTLVPPGSSKAETQSNIPAVIKRLGNKWSNDIKQDEEIYELKERLSEIDKEIKSIESRERSEKDYQTLIKLKKLEKQYSQIRDEISDKYFYLFRKKPLTKEELDLIYEPYWEQLEKLGRAKLNYDLKKYQINFKQVKPQQYVNSAIEVVLKQYAKIKPPLQIVYNQFVSSEYLNRLFKMFPKYRDKIWEIMENIQTEAESGNRDFILEPEEVLELAKYGYLRNEIMQYLYSLNYQVDISDREQIDEIEGAIRTIASKLQESGDLEIESDFSKELSKSDLNWQDAVMPDVLNIKDLDDPSYDDEFEKYLQDVDEDLEESVIREAGIEKTEGPIGPEDAIRYIPSDDGDLEEAGYNVSYLPRQETDRRPRPDEITEYHTQSWVQMTGFDYASLEPGQWAWEGFEKIGKTSKSRFLNGKVDPFHAALEWLWESLLEKGYKPEPYDGFARWPSVGSYDPEIKGVGNLIFYNRDEPYSFSSILSKEKSALRIEKPKYHYRRKGIIRPDSENPKFYKKGSVADQVPVPMPSIDDAAAMYSTHNEKYNVLFRIGEDIGEFGIEDSKPIGRTFESVYENVLELISEFSDGLQKRNLEINLHKDVRADYDKSEDMYIGPTIVHVYAYRIEFDKKGELETQTIDDPEDFWDKTKAQRLRIRGSKIFSNKRDLEKVAEFINNNDNIFQEKIYDPKTGKPKIVPHKPYLIWLALGSSPEEPTLEFLPEDLLYNLINQVKEFSYNRLNRYDPYETDVIGESDWDFPLEILRLEISRLEKIKVQNPQSSNEIDRAIKGLKKAIDDAAASKEELQRRARARRSEEILNKNEFIEQAKLQSKRDNEIRFLSTKQKVALFEFSGDDSGLSDIEYLGYNIYSIVRDLVKYYENISRLSFKSRLWDDHFDYNSFLENKKAFEKWIIKEMKNEAEEQEDGLPSYPDPQGTAEISPEDKIPPEVLELFYYRDESILNLDYAFNERFNLDGQPIIHDEQVDSKTRALWVAMKKLEKLRNKIKSAGADKAKFMLKSILSVK